MSRGAFTNTEHEHFSVRSLLGISNNNENNNETSSDRVGSLQLSEGSSSWKPTQEGESEMENTQTSFIYTPDLPGFDTELWGLLGIPPTTPSLEETQLQNISAPTIPLDDSFLHKSPFPNSMLSQSELVSTNSCSSDNSPECDSIKDSSPRTLKKVGRSSAVVKKRVGYHDKYREQNRLAARQSRKKESDLIDFLKEEEKEVELRRQAIQDEVKELKMEISALKVQLTSHVQSAEFLFRNSLQGHSCNCARFGFQDSENRVRSSFPYFSNSRLHVFN